MIECMIDKSNLEYILGFYKNNIICVLELENRNDFVRQKNVLISIYNQISKHVKSSLSIGSICEDIFSARQSYK